MYPFLDHSHQKNSGLNKQQVERIGEALATRDLP
jgi:hypothetical protein